MSVVAADFPFSIPARLLALPSFARLAGWARPFRSWERFHRAVARALPLTCPVEYGRFARWRRTRFWVRRAVDVAAGAQPPLKDRFQSLFRMTLLGNAFLARLESSGRFDVVPFRSRGRAAVVEVYPGHAMRRLGVRGYKREPRRAISVALRHLRALGVRVEVAPAVRRACATWDTGGSGGHDHDAADALVAACIGILYREGLAAEVAGAPADAREVEGALWTVPERRRASRRVRRRTGGPWRIAAE